MSHTPMPAAPLPASLSTRSPAPSALWPSIALAVLICSWLPATADAQPIVRVPQQATLQSAIFQVQNGGIIEISGGVYPSPDGGFRMRGLSKSFTVRPAVGATVVLDGGGSRDILRIENNSGLITLVDLEFRNGFSDQQVIAGGLTVRNARAELRGCVLANNLASPTNTGGGGARVADSANVSFFDCRWLGNQTPNRGAGLAIVEATVDIELSVFDGNLANPPDHLSNAVGGAIFIQNGRLEITRSHFVGNEAAFAGGALFAVGSFLDDDSGASGESTEVTINDSVFEDNVSRTNAANSPATAFAGAIFTSDQTEMTISTSRFDDNRANAGGAIQSRRAVTTIRDSVFRGNRALPTGTSFGIGGAILSGSLDFPDGSTEDGTINRRPDRMTIERSLIQGRFGSTTTTGTQGACVVAEGDQNSFYGVGGMPQEGSRFDNQAKLLVSDSVLFDCDAGTHPLSVALGGGVHVILAAVGIFDSLIIDSDALGDGGTGGGLIAFADSDVQIADSTFANNSAEQAGGGVTAIGAHLDFERVQFFANEESPGVSEPVQLARGAALNTSPHVNPSDPSRDRDVTGSITDCLFADNIGIAILETDFTNGPITDLRYNGNRFRETRFGDKVFSSPLVGGLGLSVTQLNSVTINRPAAANTNKSQVANERLTTTPRGGQLVAAPSSILDSVAPGAPSPEPARLGYAWIGASNATLDGQALATRTGVLDIVEPGDFTLRVGGTAVDTATVTANPCPDATLCLDGNRFQVQVNFRDFAGNEDTAQVVPLATDDSGLFFFFESDNWEMLVKVLDGCNATDHYWVFAAATTNIEYTLTVTDTLAGVTKTYFNPLGNAAPAIADTAALPTCSVGRAGRVGAVDGGKRASLSKAPIPILAELDRDNFKGGANCLESPTVACLTNERFRVEVEYLDFAGEAGAGQVVTGVDTISTDSGLFFFFGADNWELLVKVLNGCGLNQRYWVFAAATTTIQYRLTVTDTMTGETVSYFNPLGNAAEAVVDTDALAVCP